MLYSDSGLLHICKILYFMSIIGKCLRTTIFFYVFNGMISEYNYNWDFPPLVSEDCVRPKMKSTPSIQPCHAEKYGYF